MEGPLQILLFEDTPGDARLVKEYLQGPSSPRFELTHVDRIAKGLKLLEEKRFDLAILDMHLPDGSGEDALKGVQQRVPGIPTIVLTGTVQDEERALQMVREGVQDYLMKDGLSPQLLRRSVVYAIERKGLERLKDDFIGTVSHELRTPLTVIGLGLENLQAGILGALSEKQAQTVERNIRNVKRLGKLIDNLLDLSRLQSGRTKIEKEEVDLKDLTHEVIQNFQPAGKEGGARIYEEMAANLPHLKCDPDLIAQVLTNILSNAIRYAEEKITVKVAVSYDSQGTSRSVCTSIMNDGPGIPQEKLSELFKKFVQLDRDQRQGSYKGTGLGLALCKEIIEQHHGKIWAESPGEKGIAFHFTLPIQEGVQKND